MLDNLSQMKPKDTREKIEKALVSTVIGAKHKLGFGITDKIVWHDQLAEELHKPVRKHIRKRRVWVSKIDEIWAADLVEMQNYPGTTRDTHIYSLSLTYLVNMDGLNLLKIRLGWK